MGCASSSRPLIPLPLGIGVFVQDVIFFFLKVHVLVQEEAVSRQRASPPLLASAQSLTCG